MGTDIHPIVQVRKGTDAPWEIVDIPETGRYGNILSERDYDLFAILGNVRNGYGFAGVTTGSGFVPISDGRGIPEDAGFEIDEHGSILCPRHGGRALPAGGESSATPGGTALALVEDDEDEDDGRWDCNDCAWLGDHSWTWVSLHELIEYDWDATVVKAGVMYAEPPANPERRQPWSTYYTEWMKTPDFLTDLPESYAGGISGGGIETIPEQHYHAILRGEVARQPGVTYVVSFARKLPIRQLMSTFLADEGTLGWLKSLGEPDDVRIVMGFDS